MMTGSVSSQLAYTEDSLSTGPQTLEIDPCTLYVKQSETPRLTFEERLVLEDEHGECLDEVTIAVETDDDMFLVYQYSKDESRLLRVQSRVHSSLDTDTELRRIRRSEHTRTLRVTDADCYYKVFVLSVMGREGWRDKLEYDKATTDFVILEGSNIILLRKLAINRLFGRFRGHTINHEGELCECAYSVERGEGDDVIVERVVTWSTGEETMTTQLSKCGYIRLHRWSSSGWHLVGNELGTWYEGDVSSVKEEQASSELDVVDADRDAYFMRKEELIMSMRMYFLDQPDVQDMIADFLKNLLFEKPDDVVDFADKFFSEFVGIDWTSRGSGDSSTLETYKSLSEIKSNHTEEFNFETDLTLNDEESNVKSLGDFINAHILNAIVDKI